MIQKWPAHAEVLISLYKQLGQPNKYQIIMNFNEFNFNLQVNDCLINE